MFWDSSAIVPLLLPEARSVVMTSLIRSDEQVTVWWGTIVECHSAIQRKRRAGRGRIPELERSLERLDRLAKEADTVAPSEEIRRRAIGLLAAHDLRAADAFQLSAALAWSEGRATDEIFVCLDDRLMAAAEREGFVVRPQS